MKMILAFIQPHKLDEVTRNLEALGHFPGMSVGAVRGFGRERMEGNGEGLLEDFTDKVSIEAVVHDHDVDAVIDAIARAAHTGRYGDGMIFVLPVERFLRIATMNSSEQAL